MTMPTFRPYARADRESCLAIFDQNVPKYFGVEERTAFEEFLDDLPGPYFVLELDDTIVGCCGYGGRTEKKEVGIFSWGMIAPEHQKKGYGQLLAEERLALMRNDPTITCVTLNTSQHTAPFYARFGFETVKVTKDGFAEGLDDVEMLLTF